MYRMDADGVVFHDPSQNDEARLAMGTEASLEVNKAGSLTFTLPPGNVVYKALRKRKSVVTLYQGSEIIFRGRVLDTVMDLQNLCEVYCEGELALLIDSLQPPIEYKGSAAGYFRQMVANHNATMDADKQFVVGEVSAVTSEHVVDVETDEYRETLEEMRSLLVDEFGGYLRVRYSGGVRYLDYIKEYNSSSNQKIQFGVNLVDVERRNDTINLCTVLIPIGKKNLTIAKVNGGSVYLEDASGIAQYGRIEKVKKFERIEDEAELLEYGLKAMEQLKAERSITIKAVDMKIVDDGADSLLLGDKVYLDSEAHELSETELCTKAVIKLDMPDQSEYTFGTPLDKLTDNLSSLKKKADSDYDKLKEWLTVTDEELQLAKQWISENGDIISNVLLEMDAMNALIRLKADQTVITDLETRISSAEIKIDGANAAIDLKADRTTVTELETRMSAAEILIDGANAKIDLKAAQSTVDDLSERLSQAEIAIDGANARIDLKASKEEIEGFDYRISQAEIAIDGANAQINLKASKSVVDALGERVTSAELLIDGQNSKIEAKADLILLDGYVKTTELEAEVLKVLQYADLSQADLDVGYLDASSAQIATLDSNSITTNSLTVGGVQFDPSDYATKSWVEEQGYLKSANLSNYATQSWVIERNYTTASDVAQTLDGYVMQGELDGYATEAWVRENFSKASATYKPTAIERYGSVSGNSIPVQALNEAGTVLLTGTVDAGDVYTRGQLENKASSASVSGTISGKHDYSLTVSLTNVYGNSAGTISGISFDGRDAYDNGYDDASINSISYNKTYVEASKLYRLNLSLVANDGTTTPFVTIVDATEAFNAGAASGGGGSYDEGYTAGKNSVTLTSSGWQGSRNTVTASNGKSLAVDLPSFSASGGTSWSNNQTTVYFSTPSVSGFLASKTVDATSVYNAGYAAGKSAGGGSSGSYNDGYNAGYADAKPSRLTYGSPSYISSSKLYSVTVNAVSADGTSNEFYVYVDATAAYNAGYAAGQAAGGGSSGGGTTNVSIINTSIGSDNVLTVYAMDVDSNKILATKAFDLTSTYNKGWNACRDACTLATSVYTIKEYAPGTLYIRINSGGQTYYSSVGSDWVRTSAATAYNRPAAKS